MVLFALVDAKSLDRILIKHSFKMLGYYLLSSIDWSPYMVWSSPFYDKCNFHFLKNKKQFLQLKIRDLQIACTFSNIFRPRDDLCTFDNNKFKNYYNDIYLNELEFKKKNEDSCKTAFLDLSIIIIIIW